MNPVDFVLRHAIKHVLDETDLTDPGDIATAVYDGIPARLRALALQQALRQVVRQVISEQRAATRITVDAPLPTTSTIPSRAGLVRDWWQRSLRDRVHVGRAQWKCLADCTYNDLVFAAAERREQAARNNARARQYQELAALLNDQDVRTVRDLPTEMLARTLGSAA